jgi:hypothetical protein
MSWSKKEMKNCVMSFEGLLKILKLFLRRNQIIRWIFLGNEALSLPSASDDSAVLDEVEE